MDLQPPDGRLATAAAAAVVVEAEMPAGLACGRASCPPPLRGGLAFLLADAVRAARMRVMKAPLRARAGLGLGVGS